MRHLSQQEQIQDRKIPLELKLQFHMMSQSLLSPISAIQATWLLFIYRNAIKPLEYEFSLKCNYHGASRSSILCALAPKEPHFLLSVERTPLAFPCQGELQAAVIIISTVITSRSNQFHSIVFSNLDLISLVETIRKTKGLLK